MRSDLRGEGVATATVTAPTTREPSVASPVRTHLPTMLIEALGYLGGAIVVVALGLFGSYFWSSISTLVQLLVIAAIFVALLAAGIAVPQQLGGPAVRLRSVLWVAATIAWAFLVGFAVDNYAGLHDERMAAVAAWSALALGLLLWYLNRQPLQHLAVFVALLVGVGVGTYVVQGAEPGMDNPIWEGAAVWVVSLIWFGFAWLDKIRPAELGIALGAIGAMFGAMLCVDNPALATVSMFMLVALAVAAVVRRDFLLLAIGALGSLELLPAVIITYFPGILAAALALLAVGVLLIGAALYIARRRHRQIDAAIDLRDDQRVPPPSHV